MTATVNASTTAAMTTRRQTWRTGDCSSCAIRTPVCSVSLPTCPLSTPRTIRSAPRTARAAAPERARCGGGRSAADLLPLLRGQLALEHLARGRDRDGVDEHDVAKPLVRRYLVVDRGHDRLRGERRAGV